MKAAVNRLAALVLLVAVAVLPSRVPAAITVNGVKVVEEASGSNPDWSFTPCRLRLNSKGGTYVISGEQVYGTSNAVVACSIVAQADCTVVASNLEITLSDSVGALYCNGHAVTLALIGTNTLSGSSLSPGVYVNSGSSLTITNLAPSATLTASSGAANFPGIGGTADSPCGTIRIVGGTVFAYGNAYGAGIGGGYGSACGTVIISGGTVTANGGTQGAGIGGGAQGAGGAVTISGGFVTANGGFDGAGIGGGYNAAGGTLTVSGGTVIATHGNSEYESWMEDIGHGYVTTAATGANIFTGGSLLATSNSISLPPSNGAARVWCVTFTNADSTASLAAIRTALAARDYGTNDLVAVSGKVYAWLPDGTYIFDIAGVPWRAVVKGGNTTVVPAPVGVFVNGRDIGFASGTGWTYDGTNLTFSTSGSYTVSGTNFQGSVTNPVVLRAAVDCVLVGSDLVLDDSAFSGLSPVNAGSKVLTLASGTFALRGASRDLAGAVRIAGGSVHLLSGTFACAPSNDAARVYCVTVSGLAARTAVTVSGLGSSYGTSGIRSDAAGRVYLWLPSGEYVFTANGASLFAAVAGADTVARPYTAFGITVNGRAVGLLSGDGWTCDGTNLVLTSSSIPYVLSGTNTALVSVLASNDCVLVASNLVVDLSSYGSARCPAFDCCLHSVDLRLYSSPGATNVFRGTPRRCGIAVVSNSTGVASLSISAANASGALFAAGVAYAAAIGGSEVADSASCGRVTISGGTVIADSVGGGAAIGAGDGGTGGYVAVSGGYVFARTTGGAAAIGGGWGNAPGGSLVVSGGTVYALGCANYGSADVGPGGKSRTGGSGANVVTGGSLCLGQGLISLPPVNAAGSNVVSSVFQVGVTSNMNSLADICDCLARLDYATNGIVLLSSAGTPANGDRVGAWLPAGEFLTSANLFASLTTNSAGIVTAVRISAYGLDGFDVNGYDADGYNRSGYNAAGYDRDGYNAAGYDQDGYDRNGYNAAGYDKDGYNSAGYDAAGYDRDGYNAAGYDRDGYNRAGYNADGYNRAGFDTNGLDRAGNTWHITINGTNISAGAAAGWYYTGTYLVLTSAGPYTISGSNAAASVVSILASNDCALVASDLEITIPNGYDLPVLDCGIHSVLLELAGTTNSFTGGFSAPGITVASNAAGIASLTITNLTRDAVLSVVGGTPSAGIGGHGQYASAGAVTIRGGNVYVYGGNAGIGGARRANGGPVTVSGGTVTAIAEDGAGIGGGGGWGGAGGLVRISGGTVVATGGYGGAGIGGGYNGSGGTVLISGGTVIATGSTYLESGGAGIGGGPGYSAPTSGVVVISGGFVTAVGGYGSAGIGGGHQGLDCAVTISGGTVVATHGFETGGAQQDIGHGAAQHTNSASSTIVGGSVHLSEGLIEPLPSNGSEPVYCVVLSNYTAGAAVDFEGLGYGFRDVVADTNGCVYLWLPAGNNAFFPNGATHTPIRSWNIVTNGTVFGFISGSTDTTSLAITGFDTDGITSWTPRLGADYVETLFATNLSGSSWSTVHPSTTPVFMRLKVR